MKIIKYQLANEVPRNVVVEIPLLDAEGNPVMEEVAKQVYDENGNPVFDENGEPVVETVIEPVLVTEEHEEVEVILTDASISCATEESFNANMPIVQAEAYNGEYTVEGEFEPEPVKEPTTDEILDAMLGVTV